MPRERKPLIRLGPPPPKPPKAPKPPADPNAPKRPKAKYRPKRKTSAAPRLPAPAPVEPTGPMAGFDQFTAQDYAVAVPGKGGQTRYLTVSPLRAIMAEQAEAEEHIVTERTRQGVLYAAGLGMERPVIARILGLDVPTLEQLYASELETAVHLLMSDVQTNLYNIARDPSHSQAVRAGMYMLGKLGNTAYKDRVRGEGLTVDPQTRTIDPALLDDEQRQALRDILTSALRLAAPQREVVEGDYDEIDDAEDVL